MRQSFVWLVVAIFGLQLPALAQDTTANHQETGKACIASETSALAKDPEARCEGTASAGAERQGLQALLCAFRVEPDDRSYLLQTATPSTTMTLQGPETAIARLNPEFVARLASAIREARESGLPSAGIFSAYRAPAFGVGRFLDRFKSLHAYGLAVDMFGIGEPGSDKAKHWHEIAGRHGIFCPYGADSRAEWNHCQATPTRIICPDNPLRKTITANGPIELAAMFKVGNAVIANPPAASCVAVAANRPNDPEAVRPRVARLASPAESDRLERKHLHQGRTVASDPFAQSTLSEKTRMMFVAADLQLGGRRR
jgi:hypothetical protein